IVQLLIEAEQQHNFVGQFGIDRMPQAGRMYLQDGKAEESESPDDESGKQIGSSRLLPELFDELDEEELRENETEEKLSNLNFDEVQKQDAKEDAKNAAGKKPDATSPNAKPSDADYDREAESGTDDTEPAGQSDSEPVETQVMNQSPGKTAELAGTAAPKSESESEMEEFKPESVDMSAMKGGMAGFGARMAERIKHPFGSAKE
ncbi:MAG: hypothetical protein H7Z17_19920, partial [Fuerstia sp.]|nr:hypothetical protein [Fuerstiella sp.]